MRWLAVMLMAMALSAQAGAPWIVGTWYGQGQPYDRSEMWIAQMGADGSFHARFRACRKGKATDATNDGRSLWLAAFVTFAGPLDRLTRLSPRRFSLLVIHERHTQHVRRARCAQRY